MARSTFADANNSRPAGFFKDLFAEMYGLCAAKAPKHKFRFKSKLLNLDATSRRHSTSGVLPQYLQPYCCQKLARAVKFSFPKVGLSLRRSDPVTVLAQYFAYDHGSGLGHIQKIPPRAHGNGQHGLTAFAHKRYFERFCIITSNLLVWWKMAEPACHCCYCDSGSE